MIQSAFAIICNEEGQVLFSHRRDHDLWNLPGGGVELNESPWQCVMREVKEETGLIVEVCRLSGVYSKTIPKLETSFAFVCIVIGGDLMLTTEADDHQWFSVGREPQNTSTRHVERVRDAFLHDKQVVLREQDQAFNAELSLATKEFVVTYSMSKPGE
jgi:8-oxo-dGTP diphosphatase